MRIILKLLAAPFVLALTLLVAVLNFAFSFASWVGIFTSPKKRGKRSRSKLRFLRHHTHNTVYIENTSRCRWFTGPVRTESICRLIYPNLPA